MKYLIVTLILTMAVGCAATPVTQTERGITVTYIANTVSFKKMNAQVREHCAQHGKVPHLRDRVHATTGSQRTDFYDCVEK